MITGGERRIRDLYSHGLLLTALVLVAFVRPLFSDAAPGVSLLDSAFLVVLVAGATISRESDFPLAPVHAAAVVTIGAQIVLESPGGARSSCSSAGTSRSWGPSPRASEGRSSARGGA